MHTKNTQPWQHEHVFGQDKVRPGERRTLWVIAITAIMMVVEITTGLAYGSMALLADGLHMASHTAALGITTIAYIYTRRCATDSRFCFGTGKVNAFAGYTSAVLLALFALLMAWESISRLFNPVEIAFNQAIVVAVLGLLVNGASMIMLGGHHHDHDPIMTMSMSISIHTIITLRMRTTTSRRPIFTSWQTHLRRCWQFSPCLPASSWD